MIKKIILLVDIVCSFTLLVCGKKNILPNLTNSQEAEPEPGVFGSLEPEPLEKKPGAGAGAAWEKNQEPEPEPEPLEKKVRSRSNKKFASSPALNLIVDSNVNKLLLKFRFSCIY